MAGKTGVTKYVILVALALTGCGVAGAPVPPAAEPTPGVHVSGEARVGVTAKL